MSALDRDLLAERASAIQRHLQRVAERLPARPEDLRPMTDASDAVVLHLWQATQIAIDLGTAACVRLGLGTPGSYGDAFERLRDAGVIDADLSRRLVKAAGFRNVVADACERLELDRVHEAALHGPSDFRAFVAALCDRLTAWAVRDGRPIVESRAGAAETV